MIFLPLTIRAVVTSRQKVGFTLEQLLTGSTDTSLRWVCDIPANVTIKFMLSDATGDMSASFSDPLVIGAGSTTSCLSNSAAAASASSMGLLSTPISTSSTPTSTSQGSTTTTPAAGKRSFPSTLTIVMISIGVAFAVLLVSVYLAHVIRDRRGKKENAQQEPHVMEEANVPARPGAVHPTPLADVKTRSVPRQEPLPLPTNVTVNEYTSFGQPLGDHSTVPSNDHASLNLPSLHHSTTTSTNQHPAGSLDRPLEGSANTSVESLLGLRSHIMNLGSSEVAWAATAPDDEEVVDDEPDSSSRGRRGQSFSVATGIYDENGMELDHEKGR